MKNSDSKIRTYLSTYHKNNLSTRSEVQENNNVKNKSPAPIQITVEQILKETYSGYKYDLEKKDFYKYTGSLEFRDKDELDDYRIKKRKDFEDSIRRKSWKISLYLSYAKWESLQNNFRHSRSIFERALNVNYEHTRIWREYINMEVVNGNINNARNLYERVTNLLPMVEEFWIKYLQMEQILKNYINVRHIYKNWLKWKPEINVYIQYSKFEEECGEIEEARNIMRQLISLYPEEKTYIVFAKFEQKYNQLLGVMNVFEFMISNYTKQKINISSNIFVFFSNIFIKEKKFTEAIKIYNCGIILLESTQEINLLKEKLFQLYKIISKERIDENSEWINNKTEQYRNKLLSNPENFDLWFDYSVFTFQYLEQDFVKKIVDTLLTQAPINDIFKWEKYLYSLLICIYFFESNVEKSESIIIRIFNQLVKQVETIQAKFGKQNDKNNGKGESFDSTEFLNSNLKKEEFSILSEVFIFYSNYQLRKGNIGLTRKILGNGLGRIPCPKLFEYYINLELKLGNFDRCRILFTKYVEYDPVSADIWIQYMQFEYKLREIKRVVSIAEAAISMPELDSPEIIWQYYIDTMIEEKDLKKADNIYKRLLEKTQHFQVVINYSMFIISKLNDFPLNREFILKMLNFYKQKSLNYERSILIKYWLFIEEKLNIKGSSDEIQYWTRIINKLLPRTTSSQDKDKQYIFNEDQYDFEYLKRLGCSEEPENNTYTESENNEIPLSLIDAARKWKRIKLQED